MAAESSEKTSRLPMDSKSTLEYDHLKLASCQKIKDYLQSKKSHILYSDMVQVQCFGKRTEKPEVSLKSLVITEKAILLLSTVIKTSEIRYIDADSIIRLVFSDLISISLLYSLSNMRHKYMANRESDFVLTLVGSIRLRIQPYNNHSLELIKCIIKAYRDRLGISLPIQHKDVRWKSSDHIYSREKFFNHETLQKLAQKPAVLEIEVDFNHSLNQTPSKNGWKRKHVAISTEFLVVCDSAEDLEALRYFYSHEKHETSGCIPFEYFICYLLRMRMADIELKNKTSNDSEKKYVVMFEYNANSFPPYTQMMPYKSLEEGFYLRFDSKDKAEEFKERVINRFYHSLNAIKKNPSSDDFDLEIKESQITHIIMRKKTPINSRKTSNNPRKGFHPHTGVTCDGDSLFGNRIHLRKKIDKNCQEGKPLKRSESFHRAEENAFRDIFATPDQNDTDTCVDAESIGRKKSDRNGSEDEENFICEVIKSSGIIDREFCKKARKGKEFELIKDLKDSVEFQEQDGNKEGEAELESLKAMKEELLGFDESVENVEEDGITSLTSFD